MLDADHSVPDVRLERGRVQDRRGPAHDVAVLKDQPGLFELDGDLLALNQETHEFSSDPIALHADERVLADEALLGQVDLPVQAEFVRIRVQAHVRLVIQDAGFHAAGVIWSRGNQTERLPLRRDEIDHRLRPAVVEEEDLVADFPRPPGPGDDDGYPAFQLCFHPPVVAQRLHAVADQCLQETGRLGALDLDWEDLGLAHGRPQPHAHSHAFDPEMQVAVGRAEPETVLAQAHHDGVVDNSSVLITDDGVLALADLPLPHVTGGQEIHQFEAIGTIDLHRTLDGDVPERDPMADRFVLLLLCLSVEIDGVKTMIVHEERCRSQPPEQRKERRLQMTRGMHQAIIVEPAPCHLHGQSLLIVVLGNGSVPRHRSDDRPDHIRTRWGRFLSKVRRCRDGLEVSARAPRDLPDLSPAAAPGR